MDKRSLRFTSFVPRMVPSSEGTIKSTKQDENNERY